jgi:hypothetical protein
MFEHSKDIPLDNIPVVSFLANGESSEEKDVSPHHFTYGMDIPFSGLPEKE